MFETNLLSLVINNCSKLSVYKDKTHYRLDLTLTNNKLYNLNLNTLLNKITNDNKFNFNGKRYFLNNKNAIKFLELLIELNIINNNTEFFNEVSIILSNKDLFTRSKGKTLTTEELIRLEQLYLQLK